MAQPAWRGLLFWGSGTLLSGMLSAYAAIPTEGGIRLNQTRIIFPASEKAQTVTITNSGNRTYLVQSRVQLNVNNTTPAPFFATPRCFYSSLVAASAYASYTREVRCPPIVNPSFSFRYWQSPLG